MKMKPVFAIVVLSAVAAGAAYYYLQLNKKNTSKKMIDNAGNIPHDNERHENIKRVHHTNTATPIRKFMHKAKVSTS